jgi:hypothetical protein
MAHCSPDVFNMVIKTVPDTIIIAETVTFTACNAIKAHISLVTFPPTHFLHFNFLVCDLPEGSLVTTNFTK